MGYEQLVVVPATAFLLVILMSIVAKFSFRRQKHLALDSAEKTVFEGLQPTTTTLQATYNRKRSIFLFLAFASITTWLGWQAWTLSAPEISAFKPLYIIFGAYALVQYFISSFVKPFANSGYQEIVASKLSLAVVVPAYNEDPEALKKGLASLMTQSILPKEIHVVDDGSSVDYTTVRAWLKRTGKRIGVTTTWSRQKNAGKRAAQLRAFSKVDQSNIDIIVTVDSDCELDPYAFAEGIKPFATDKEIQSVAGVVIAKNAQHNLLARITDLIFVSSQQLIDRATMSSFKSVIVNSGGLALYRKAVFQNALKNDYDEEYFMDRKVTFSDDSYLTLIALKMGKTVQQPTALVFSDMPVKVSHHVRQQVRWGRGSFIRGLWRVRYLPMLSAGFLRQVFGWAILTAITIVQVLLFVVIPIVYDVLPSAYLILMPVAFMFLLSSRYFAVRRSDMTLASQIGTYMLAPIAMVWSALILRSIRLYAISTCAKTGWGTRQKVEISYNEGDSELAPSAS